MNANGVALIDIPIGIGFNSKHDEVFVANKTDIRRISAFTGKTIRILSSIDPSLPNIEISEV